MVQLKDNYTIHLKKLFQNIYIKIYMFILPIIIGNFGVLGTILEARDLIAKLPLLSLLSFQGRIHKKIDLEYNRQVL